MHRTELLEEKHLENNEKVYKNGVKNIQAVAHSDAPTVHIHYSGGQNLTDIKILDFKCKY